MMAFEDSWVAVVFLSSALVLALSFIWVMVNRRKTQAIKTELQTILDALEPVALIDTSYTIVRVNQLYAASVGRSYASLIGRKCYKVHENRDTPCPGCQLYKAVLEKKPQLMPAVSWRVGEHQVWYDISFHPVIAENGRVEYVVETKKDITTLHKIKMTLEDQKLDLERKTRELAEKNQQLSRAYIQLENALDEKNQELEMAREIQQSLMPAPPRCFGHLSFWVVYEPIHHVGGDLYDFIPLGDGQIAVFIGDVSGHGLPAAFIASLAKLSLHNHLDKSLSPQSLFRAINQDLRKHLKTGHYLTAFFAIIDIKKNEIRYVRGSHPPPVLLRRDGSVARLDAKGMLIGLLPEPEFQEHVEVLQAGDRLFLFTDGCFSSFGEEELNPVSYARFTELVQEYGRLPLDAVFGALNVHLRAELGMAAADDDRTFIGIEVVKPALNGRYRYLMHFSEAKSIRRMRFGARRDLDVLLDRIVERLEEHGYSERIIGGICNSVQEIVMNALIHGHRGDESKKLSVAWSVTAERFCLSCSDQGNGFNPGAQKNPRGKGILLVRTYMDDVFFDRGGRTVTIIKKRA